MARNTFSCADIRFRESSSAPASTSKSVKTLHPYIEPKFRRGAPEEADGLKVWQCRRDVNFRAFGNQVFHNPDASPRFYATKSQIKHQRKNVSGKEAKALVGLIHEDSRRDQRARTEAAKLDNSLPKNSMSGFMGCMLKNKKPILQYVDAEKDDLDFTFSGILSVDADIKYNCSFFPSNGPKQIDLRRYKDYVDLFVNYSGKQHWQLYQPYKLTANGKPLKAKVFWTQARDFRTSHPISIKREWNEEVEIVDAAIEPDFIEPTGLDDSFDIAETASCAATVVTKVLPSGEQGASLPAAAQIKVDLLSVVTSDEAQSCVSEHSLPKDNVKIDSDSSSDDLLEITIPDLPEAIFADAIGVFDDTEEEDLSSSIPLPWAIADQSMDVEVSDVSVPLVVMPPTVAPALVLSKQFKHPFINSGPQVDSWQTEEEHETYLAYGTELPASPYELPTDPFEHLSITELKNKFIKERLGSSEQWLEVKLENLELSNKNRDLEFELDILRNASSTKTLANFTKRNKELEEVVETWRGRAIEKSARAATLSVSLSAVYDILDNMMWLRGATPLRFIVNSEPTFHPRFGDQKQVIAQQCIKNESRNCPNTSDKCDPESKHQCFQCISSFRVSACMAIVLEGLLKTESSLTEFQRTTSNPSTMSMLENRYAMQKRPSEAPVPSWSTTKQAKRSPESQVLSDDLTPVSKPTFCDGNGFTQSSPANKTNINNVTIDDRNTQDFTIEVHASESDSDDHDPR